MFPNKSNKMTHLLDEPLDICKQRTKEVIDYLSLAIQSIAAGTVAVSDMVISETCMEYKIQLSPSSPFLILQYDSESDDSDIVNVMSTEDDEQFDENSKIYNENTKKCFDGLGENSTPLDSIKQISEPLSMLNKDVKIRQSSSYDGLQENRTKVSTSERNVYSKSNLDSIVSSDESVSSSDGKELTAAMKNATGSHTDEFHMDYEDETYKGLQKHKKTADFTEKKYSCCYCGKSFKTTVYTKKRYICDNFPASGRFSLFKSGRGSKKTYRCSECGKTFTTSGNLIAHKRIHTGERPFTCEDCGKSFTQLSTLRQHKRIHTGEKSFTCDDCGKSFTQLSTLCQHRRIHTGEKSFVCEVCGKSFTQLSTLRQHKMIHTGDSSFTCEVCGKSFIHLSSLIRHKRTHTR